jgi:aminopeptidase YwaD
MKKLAFICIAILFLPFVSGQSNNDYVEVIIEFIDEDLMRQYVQTLQEFGPRVTGEQGCFNAGQYIFDEFKSYGYEVRFHNWSNGELTDRNVEAILPGEKNESVIICAHYDSVPGSPGADDNGSGTAAVLAAAKALSEYKDWLKSTYTVRFITFSGEEQGLYGSSAYAEEAYNNGMAIRAVLNADMIGYTDVWYDKFYVVVREGESAQWITNVATALTNELPLRLRISRYEAGYGSDHYSFLQYGYDAVFFHEYRFNDYYHSPEDTIDKMDMQYTMRVTKLMVGTLVKIVIVTMADTKPPEVQLEKPGNFLYFQDREIMPTVNPLIIGKITIQVDAYDEASGISKVNIFVDNRLKKELINEPYEWLWDGLALFRHRIKATAYDNAANSSEKTIEVTIFNL